MAVTYLQGNDTEVLLRAKNTGEFKRLVCEETLTFEVTNDVTVVKTKHCGKAVGVADPDVKANGLARCNFTPTEFEVSYDQAVEWQNSVTELDWIIRNIATGSYAAGEALRFSGTGYIVGTSGSMNQGETISFTWNLEATGTLNTTES